MSELTAQKICALRKKIEQSSSSNKKQLDFLHLGDCRRALQLLCTTVNSNGSVTMDDLHEASKTLDVDKTELAIKQRTIHQKLLLLSLAKLSLDNKTSTTQMIYRNYCSLNANVKHLSSRRIHDLLIELERLQIIDRKTRSKGRHGYFTEYSLLIDPGIVGWLIDFDWWGNTLDEKERVKRFIEAKKNSRNVDN